jgi:3-oxoacyl-[acyl-carrier-protein] synthase-3
MAHYLDTNDEWIRARTGIRERRIVGPDETTRTLGTTAACQALDAAGLTPDDLDTIIVATATPDHPMPSTASEIAADLASRPGMSGRVTPGAFDVNAACAGFVYALTVAGSLLATGAARRVLLVGADTMSRVVDQQDRSSAVLFADGAAALVLHQPDQAGSATPPIEGGIIACDLVDDPDAVDLLVIPGGGSAEPATFDTVNAGRHFLRMDGNEVFRRAVRGVAESVERTLSRAGVRAEDVDLFVPHQANARIIDAVLPRIGIEPAQTVQTVDHHGNTSAASIPLALAEAAAAGRLADGHLVLTSGFGAGVTIGTALLRWQT